MGKFIVHTSEVETYLQRMHEHYTEQEEIILEHVKALNSIKDILATEDLSVIEEDLESVIEIGKDFTSKRMPPLILNSH